MKYVPKLNDYVAWTNSLGQVTEGWVYYCGDEHISIEVDVKEKPDELVSMHKKIHVLVVCYSWHWDELEYVKSRRNRNAETLEDMEIYIRKFQ